MSSPNPEHNPAELQRMFGALLRIPFQALVMEIERALRHEGVDDLRPAHFTVFQHLPAKGCRLTYLAQRAQMTKQSMGELVRHLERNGYVQRFPDPADRRAQVIQRTERGWNVEQIARSCIESTVDGWSQRMGEERFEDGLAFLRDLVEIIEEDSGEHT